MNRLHICSGFIVGLLVAGPASAATITFNAVVSAGNPILTTLTTDGFTFTSSHFHTIDNPALGGAVSNSTIYISEEAGGLGGPITMTPSAGGVFSLTGFDGAEVFLIPEPGFPDANTLRVHGNIFGGGTITTFFALDGLRDGPGGLADFQTFALVGFDNLTSVVFDGLLVTGGPGGISLDNLVVNQTAAVPEPATLLLLGGGMATLAARRRKAKGRTSGSVL